MSTDRWAAVAGILYVVMDIVVGLVAGAPPAPGGSQIEITDYIADHRDGVAAGLWLFGLASVALLWWFGSLWRLMVGAESGASRLAVVSLVGLVLGGTMAFASSVVMATLGLVDSNGSVTTFYAMGAVFLSASGFGLGVHLLATNSLAIRSGMFPAWLAVIGLLSAAAFLLSAVMGAIENDTTSNTVSLGGFAVWLLWIVGVSVWIWSEEPMTRVGQEEPMAA